MNKKSKLLVLGLVGVGLVLYVIFILLGRRTKPDALSVANSLKNKAMQQDYLGTNAKFLDGDSDLNGDGHYDIFAYVEHTVTSRDSLYPLHIRKGMLLQLRDKKYQTLLNISKDKITDAQNKPIIMQEPTPSGYLMRLDTLGNKLILEMLQSDSLGNPTSESLFLEWKKDHFQPSH